MPPYLPWHFFLVEVSGVCEIALGLLLLVPLCTRWAAWGLIALLVAVFPANLHMAVHPELYPEIPAAALWARLPLQAVLIAWACGVHAARAAAFPRSGHTGIGLTGHCGPPRPGPDSWRCESSSCGTIFSRKGPPATSSGFSRKTSSSRKGKKGCPFSGSSRWWGSRTASSGSAPSRAWRPAGAGSAASTAGRPGKPTVPRPMA